MKVNLEELEKLVFTQNTDNWKFIEKVLTYCDCEDGGGWYKLIIQSKLDNKFYLIEYCDWDIDNDDLVNYTQDNLLEVFPKVVTKIIYVRQNEL
jgi:hypothetical protein